MKHYLYAVISLLVLFFLFLFGFSWLNNSIIFTLNDINQSLTTNIEKASEGTGWILALVSFIYGVLHSIGPGHGKFVLSSYSIANNPKFLKLAALGLTISLLQGVTAVVIGWLALSFFSSSTSQFLQISNNLVLISGIMIAVLAFLWLKRALTRLIKIYRMEPELEQPTDHHASVPLHAPNQHTHHHHHHGCSCTTHASAHEVANHEVASHPHHHGAHPSCNHEQHHATSCGHPHKSHVASTDKQHNTHPHNCGCTHQHTHSHDLAANTKTAPHQDPHHVHGPDCGCGNHLDWDKFNELDSFRDRLIMATSIILRPCTGAIFVLIFAYSINLWWWGVASAMFMALGTGIGLIFTVQIITWIKVLGFDRFKGKPSRKRAIFTQLVFASLALALLLVSFSTIQTGLKGEDGNRLYTRDNTIQSLELQENTEGGTLGGSDSEPEPLPLDTEDSTQPTTPEE